jgi:hypothetical protein
MTSFFSKVAALWQKPNTRTKGIDSRRPESFVVLQSNMDGHPLMAMIDLSLGKYGSKSSFPWFLSISAPLIDPTKDGLPSSDDNLALNAWEDFLERALTSEGRFVYVGHVTWNGSRELLYYVEKPELVVASLKKLQGEHATRPFAFRCEPDEKWDRVSVYFSGRL